MPAPNDLTPEEEREFAQFGVPSAGQGREPLSEQNERTIVDGNQPAQSGSVTEGGQPVHQPQTHGDREPPQQSAQEALQQQQGQQQEQQVDREALRQQINPKRENGQFKSKDEIEAEIDQLAAAQQGQQQQQQAPPPGFVPHQALHAERMRTQQMAQQLSLATARLNAMLTRQPQQQQGLELPDLNTDPVGYVQALGERMQELEQQRQEEIRFREIDTALEQDEQAFQAMVPDYQAASDHYVQSRAQELLQFYPPQEAHRMMVMEARAIAQNAWQRGIPAAQAVYQLAQARGYNPQNTSADPTRYPVQGQQPQPQGQQPQPQGQQPPRGPTPQAQVQALQNFQQNGPRSLSGGAGAGRTEALNADALLKMSDSEFEQYLGLGKKGASERFAAIG